MHNYTLSVWQTNQRSKLGGEGLVFSSPTTCPNSWKYVSTSVWPNNDGFSFVDFEKFASMAATGNCDTKTHRQIENFQDPKKEKEKREIVLLRKKLLEVIITNSPPSFSQLFTKCGFCAFCCHLCHTHKVMEPKDTNLLLVHHTQKLWTKCTTDLPTTKGRFIKQENWSVYLPDKDQ